MKLASLSILNPNTNILSFDVMSATPELGDGPVRNVLLSLALFSLFLT